MCKYNIKTLYHIGTLNLYVVYADKEPLIDRKWLKIIKFKWQGVFEYNNTEENKLNIYAKHFFAFFYIT